MKGYGMMNYTYRKYLYRSTLTIILIVVTFSCTTVLASQKKWKRKEVDWRASGGSRITAVNYPEDKPVPLRSQRSKAKGRVIKKITWPKIEEEPGKSLEPLGMPVLVNVINSPPLDGFVPWVVVSFTDSSVTDDFNAYPASSVTGSFIPTNPATQYGFGIFDTGASASLISFGDAAITELYSDGMVTSSEQILIGASGSTAIAYASFPLGLFVDGIDVIDPNGEIDTSAMMGETNVSVIVGDGVESPLLPTAIGAPLAYFHNVAFCNNKLVDVNFDGQDVNSPYIDFYELDDPCTPYYSNKIILKLLPAGELLGVQYLPCIEPIFDCPDGDYSPLYSSLIVDGWWSYQGLYFVNSVDLSDDGNTANDRQYFMFDTGAQVSVISELIAARLELDTGNPANWDFSVEILDVTGSVTTYPGFYIDTIDIIGSPKLEYENVPVVVIDISFPGVGVMDGIIGMNLFTDLNFVFRGGGIGLDAPNPYIRYEPVCDLPGDIAGDCYECVVDNLDLEAFVSAWLGTEEGPSENWNFQADIAPEEAPDGLINGLDYAVFANDWMVSIP
jgi:hypothetical protein